VASTERSTLERRAQAELIAAERAGVVTRPRCCEWCGAEPEHEKGIQAHHWLAYDQPLIVWWLCIPCHEVAHRRLKAEDRQIPLHTPPSDGPNSGDTRASDSASVSQIV
jgi:hypothetical protein